MKTWCGYVLVAAALLSVPAAIAQAQTPNKAQQDAIRSNCRSDFMRNCSSVTPGGREALECLVQNKAKVSAGCQGALNAVSPPLRRPPSLNRNPKRRRLPEPNPRQQPQHRPKPHPSCAGSSADTGSRHSNRATREAKARSQGGRDPGAPRASGGPASGRARNGPGCSAPGSRPATQARRGHSDPSFLHHRLPGALQGRAARSGPRHPVPGQ